MPERAQPGQVYWNATQQRLAVVYAVDGERVKVVAIGVGPWHRATTRRFTWKQGVPSTWVLQQR